MSSKISKSKSSKSKDKSEKSKSKDKGSEKSKSTKKSKEKSSKSADKKSDISSPAKSMKSGKSKGGKDDKKSSKSKDKKDKKGDDTKSKKSKKDKAGLDASMSQMDMADALKGDSKEEPLVGGAEVVNAGLGNLPAGGYDLGGGGSMMQDHNMRKKMCLLHKQPLRYFCESCEELICYDCTVMGPHNTQLHRISSIEDAFKFRFETINKTITQCLVPKRA